MALSSAVRRGWLRSVWRKGQEDGLSLVETLEAAEAAASERIAGGQTVAGVGKGALRTEFFNGKDGGISPVDVAELAAEARDLYDIAKAALTEGSADDAIFVQMLSYWQRVTSCRTDFSGLSL